MSIPINATKSGNDVSFDELYEQYHTTIARRVMTWLHVDRARAAFRRAYQEVA